MSEKLKEFKEYLEKLSYHTHVISQMYWDMQTATPKKGYGYKVDAVTYFSTEAFKLETSEEYGKLLEAMASPEEYDRLDDAMKLTVRRKKKSYDENRRIPQDFYQEMVREQAIAGKVWEEAKQKSDYALFCPHLEKLIDYRRQLMAYTRPDMEVYDAMLDMFEEGMDSATIDRLFEDLKAGLVPLIRRIGERQKPDVSMFEGDYPIHKQKELGAFLLDYMGFDREAGVMGESEHPFTMGFGPGDVRVTNHYSEHEVISAIYSIIHEGGHAIFEQGVNPAFEKTAAADITLLGLHESQSRFYENILGRNINFWKPIYGKLGEYLPKFREISPEDFERAVNRVTPSLIRTEADEVTYSLHVILRYEIEKAIFREGVKAEELPALWNRKMVEYLGVCPSNDAEGILQDMHWSDGSMGYFPTYALGNIYDGMFLEALQTDLGDVDTILAEGRIKDITRWLHDNIHQYGSLYNSKEVLERVCRKQVSAAPILKYFEEKYSKIYHL